MSRPLTVAYLILSHHLPEQLRRLICTLIDGSRSSEVVIVHDYSKCPFNESIFENNSRVHILSVPISATWSDFSIVSNTLYGLQWVEENVQFDWLVLISGQDYPLKPLTAIEQEFSGTKYDGFIQGYFADEPNPLFQDQTYSRYFFRYITLPKFPYYYRIPRPFYKLFRKIRVGFKHKIPIFRLKGGYRGTNLRLGVRWPTIFSKSFRCRVGRQWFSINKKCVRYVNSFVKKNPWFVAYYRRRFVPDESFFHTILHNNPDLSLANDSKVYVYFNDEVNAASPQILSLADLPQMLESTANFGRKFDAHVDSDVLDKLDTIISAQTKASLIN